MTQMHEAVVHAYEGNPLSSVPPAVRANPGIAISPAPAIRLTIHDSLAAVEQDWREFERAADCTVFQTFDYLALWQKHVGERRRVTPAIVVARRAGGEILLMLPLAVERHGFFRRLTWLGEDLCDYLAPLLAADFPRSVGPGRFALLWREILQLLQRTPHLRHDFVELRKMPAAVGGQRNPFLDLPLALHPSGAHLMQLDGDWESFYAARRSSATRRRDRSKKKRLAEHGEIRFVTPADDGEIGDTLAILYAQKSRAFAGMGVANMFARPGYREFFLALATHPKMRDAVHVSRLEVGAGTAATNLGLEHRGRYYHVLASHDGGELSRFGPGIVHLHELIGRAIGRGLKEFDFTVGDERYKREWADTELRLHDHVATATARGLPFVLYARGFAWVKRLIKQTPFLWSGYCRLRALTGAVLWPG